MDVLGVSIFLLIFCCQINIDKCNGNEPLYRHKRETRPCKDKFKILLTHSACQPRSPRFERGGVNSTEQAIILREHNQYRGSVTPPATNMFKMTWDNEVAEVAQAWAETCAYDHDKSENRYIPGRFPLGQNIGQGYTNWIEVIKAWRAEVKDFTYGGNNDFFKVGHYTQLVWAESVKIGCGMADCGQYAFHVCNYAPAGNIGDINKPYVNGNTCYLCQNCSNKLCDCGQKVCENGGIFHQNNCSCTCKNPVFQTGDQCKLDCTNLKQPPKCGGNGFDAEGCKKYPSVVPYDCPKTCSACPYGAYNYKEQGIYIVNKSPSCGYSLTFLVLGFLARIF